MESIASGMMLDQVTASYTPKLLPLEDGGLEMYFPSRPHGYKQPDFHH